MLRFQRMVRFLVLMLLFLAPAGCSKGFKLAPVSGRVTMDNKPLAGAEVSFYLMNGDKDTPYASGTTDDQGNYKLEVLVGGSPVDGGVVGENRVMISRNKLNGPKKVLPKDIVRGLDEVPARYNQDSTLTFAVPPGGSNEASFQLTNR